MSWLENFIEEIASAWARQKQELAGWTRFEGMAEAPTIPNPEIGGLGEDYVRHLISRLGYESAPSPGSRTPADVWGFKELRGMLHLAQIQVKTTQKREKPQELSEEEKQDFSEFAGFVWDRLQNSTTMPEKLKSKPMVLSQGYAGVTLREQDDRLVPYLYSTRYFGASYSEALEKGWGMIEEEIKKFHDLR